VPPTGLAVSSQQGLLIRFEKDDPKVKSNLLQRVEDRFILTDKVGLPKVHAECQTAKRIGSVQR
jgi:hypothetical protein